MCTAISLNAGDHYFGRNLDLNQGYREEVTITPRKYPFRFRNGTDLQEHYAIIGMATVAGDYPLYYDATNEAGLSIAALNFPSFAHYQQRCSGKYNIAPFELIPWILSQCAQVRQAYDLLKLTNLWHLPYSREFMLTPLHWIISDGSRSIAVEPLQDGLQITEDPAGVLTNSPPLSHHMQQLGRYSHLSAGNPEAFFAGISVPLTGNGVGAVGLPGDYSSPSRFIKAAFVKEHAVRKNTIQENVNQFLHLLRSVAMPEGAVEMEDGSLEKTIYSSCCNASRGIYFYTTYENSRISAVDLRHENLEGEELITYPLRKMNEIFFQN